MDLKIVQIAPGPSNCQSGAASNTPASISQPDADSLVSSSTKVNIVAQIMEQVRRMDEDPALKSLCAEDMMYHLLKNRPPQHALPAHPPSYDEQEHVTFIGNLAESVAPEHAFPGAARPNGG